MNVSLLIGCEREETFDLVVLRKKYRGRCQIPSSKNCLETFHEKCFSISSWTCSTEMRAGGGVCPSQIAKEKKKFLIWLFYEKIT